MPGASDLVRLRHMLEAARKAAMDVQSQADKGNRGVFCGAAIELRNGTIITGANSPLMHSASSLILNTVKHLAEIPPHLHLLSPNVIESIANLKQNVLDHKSVSLDLEESLIALSICSTTNQ